MEKQILSSGWTLTIPDENVYHIPPEPITAAVPGSVYSCLLDHGLMPDPYYRENELTALKLMENDFVYEDTFTADEKLMDCDRVALKFNGIDTIADLFLNGEFLGHTENMHRSYEFEVKDLLARAGGEGHLVVKISSPTKWIAAAHEQCDTLESKDAMPGYPHLRKAHCMFGWDWGPRLPDAGLFRTVELLGIRKARLTNDLRILQEHTIEKTTELGNTVSRVDLTVTAGTDPANAPGTHIECTLTDPDGAVRSFDMNGKDPEREEASGSRISITDPKLWWPNGFGGQPLYTVTVRLVDDATGAELDRAEKRIGLRTLTVDVSPYPDEKKDPHIGPQLKEDLKEGRHFNFVVNGLPIFAMGADYIPEDCILSRVTPQRTRKLLTDAAEANYNCIRIWGGGYYLDDHFYDTCDELGLLIWHDFMFACASYDLNDRFEENIRAEFVEVIRRLRHHASLGLWGGNNEMEEEVYDAYVNHYLPHDKQFYDYIKIYEYILPQILKVEDPVTFYWPSSPSSGGNYEDFHEENMGDIHYWGVWHGGDPFTAYRQHHYRFLSEFGFQSFPDMATIRAFTEPEDRNMFSEVMEMHQRNTAANGKIMNYLSATYQYPKDFDSLVYCTQMLQLDAIRYGVEYFRRIRGTCMGTVVWQLNDNWPVASWASIDYFGRWKALHYGEKRFFAPVSITCEEHGRIDQKPFVNSLPVPVEFSACLHVANETRNTVKGTVNWQLRRADSAILHEGSKEIDIAPFSGTWLDKEIYTCLDDERDMHLWYEFVEDGTVVSSGSALFVAPKHYFFADPNLSLTVDRDAKTITVRAEAYAKGVCISSGDGNLKLSDNYFDMEKGERTVQIVGEAPEGTYRVRSVYDTK